MASYSGNESGRKRDGEEGEVEAWIWWGLINNSSTPAIPGLPKQSF
jgi:hypothetical protein